MTLSAHQQLSLEAALAGDRRDTPMRLVLDLYLHLLHAAAADPRATDAHLVLLGEPPTPHLRLRIDAKITPITHPFGTLTTPLSRAGWMEASSVIFGLPLKHAAIRVGRLSGGLLHTHHNIAPTCSWRVHLEHRAHNPIQQQPETFCAILRKSARAPTHIG